MRYLVTWKNTVLCSQISLFKKQDPLGVCGDRIHSVVGEAMGLFWLAEGSWARAGCGGPAESGRPPPRRVPARAPRPAMRTSASPRRGNGRYLALRPTTAQCARSLAASGSVRSARTHAREPRAWWWLAGEVVLSVHRLTDDMSCDRRTRAARLLDLRWVRNGAPCFLSRPTDPLLNPRVEWCVRLFSTRCICWAGRYWCLCCNWMFIVNWLFVKL